MQYQFTVQGMTCGHCENAVTQAVKALDREATVQIDRARDSVTVNSIEPRDTIASAIIEEGYTVAP